MKQFKKTTKFYLGEEVLTNDNLKGIIVKLKMDYNGLYLTPERSQAVVWFGGTNRLKSKWINKMYNLDELVKIKWIFFIKYFLFNIIFVFLSHKELN